MLELFLYTPVHWNCGLYIFYIPGTGYTNIGYTSRGIWHLWEFFNPMLDCLKVEPLKLPSETSLKNWKLCLSTWKSSPSSEKNTWFFEACITWIWRLWQSWLFGNQFWAWNCINLFLLQTTSCRLHLMARTWEANTTNLPHCLVRIVKTSSKLSGLQYQYQCEMPRYQERWLIHGDSWLPCETGGWQLSRFN